MKDAEITEARRTIADLTRMPVGRRWLLKMGVSAAAALALPAWAAAQEAPPAAPRSRRGTVFHFALGSAAAFPDLTVVVNGRKIPLTPHTRSTHSALRSQGTLWRKIRLGQLTHFAHVLVPRHRAVLLSVYGTHHEGRTVVVALSFHAPAAATGALASAAFLLQGSYDLVAGAPERLAALGVNASQLTSVREIVDLDTVVDPHQTAITLTMMHPNVATTNSAAVAATKSLLGKTAEVSNLGNYLGQSGTYPIVKTPAVDRNGTPSQITIKGVSRPLSTIRFDKADTTFTELARSALVAGIHGVRGDGTLGAVLDKPLAESPPDTRTWHQPEGIVIHPTPYNATGALGEAVQVHLQNPGVVHGTQVVVDGALSGRRLTLKLYNNFVRWVMVYAQYLKADGTNLSVNADAKFPNTRYSTSLGMLPQIFTLFGVPLWNTNTISVTLDFPLEATSARLLLCGLGNDAVDGGWRQYFPSDAYPHHIAPQDEVLVAALMTGIVTIGLTGFALALDIVAASSFNTARDFAGPPLITGGNAEEAIDTVAEDFRGIAGIGDNPLGGAFSESEAQAVEAMGGVTAVAEGVSLNFAEVVEGIATAIPKTIFSGELGSPMWPELAGDIVGAEAAEDVLDAIPIIGLIVAVLAAAGDIATLAQAIGETVASPWVIANQISLTYTATVRVQHDPDIATWPRLARSWRLESKIDGATALTPVTGTINEGGRVQSDDLVLQNLTVPFGGDTVTWSIVVLDAQGNQIGTGAKQLPNDDSSNLPTDVTFAITELPEPITAATVFTRDDTTTFTSGYTWSDAVPDTGTIASSGVQEVTGVAIATTLGVAGIVWKQNDKYWLRGVPVAENGTTITLGGATRQGFARRPFLLFDSLVGPTDRANHVLLEPDDTGPGYHIRRLTIDPATAALSWDPNVSHGFYALPVSAAALHSSGWVVAVNTDFSRLGRLLPAATPLPPLAAYTAGPGKEIGLLSSPTAVAVTHPGIVIVLEAGASQLAAFDLNGNPVRYFGTASPAAFTLALPTSATYLDIAVDGSGQIYVLSHRNDGHQVSDYRIDVYTPNGTPLATNSPGTNVPRLAVDYFRSIYAANYTALLDSAGQSQIDPALGVAEPSLSVFDPITPS